MTSLQPLRWSLPTALRICVIAVLALANMAFSHEGCAEPNTTATGSRDSEMLAALGANGPRPGAAAGARAFDRVIGTWEFDCTIYAEDGSTNQFDGEWRFDWILDGAAIQDVWIGFQEGRAPGRRHMGTSLRFFDPKLGQWRVLFIVPLSGKIIQLQGGESGDRIVLNGVDVDGARLRWTFNDLEANSFLWRGEISHDGGKSWHSEQIMKLRRKHAT
jgi:hypothetical protein